MDSKEGNSRTELKPRIFKIFKEFLTRVTKLEELGGVGSRLLLSFQEGLEFLRRPPINRTSELIEKIIKANETERLTSYVEAGGINSHDAVKSMDKDKEMSSGLDHQVSVEKGEMLSYGPEEPEIMDFAVLMGIIYSMLKQDYVMQERIVKGLNLKSSSGELESYSLMWSLRPFVKDEIMHQAWTYIP